MGVSRHADGFNYLWEGQETGGCSVIPEINKNNSDCGGRMCCLYNFRENSSVSGIRYAEISVGQAYYITNGTFTNATICSQSCSDNNATIFYDQNYNQMKLTWAFPLPLNQTPFNDTSKYNRSSSDNPYQPSNELENAIRKLSKFPCSNNSQLLIVDSVGGYRCSCPPGYEGDGYRHGTGCQDIKECANPAYTDCIYKSRCHESVGNYTCKCKSIFQTGDGRHSGTGCHFSPLAKNVIIAISGIVILVISLACICLSLRWWRSKLKMRNFMQNGGLQLQEYIHRSGRDTTRLFSIEELREATQNFSNSMKIGVGGFGTVYKGVLENRREVAIKMATKPVKGDNEQFINEVTILTQINHRHIVKLLGCCLETTNPLIVYEYVSNGNLLDNLEMTGGHVMSWEHRLRVAKQTSQALAYLHSIATPPILHRDVKSANVLLDNNWDAKVADFGVSRLLPEGVEHISTAIKGTLGYLDPEYFQTLQLTEKSDVYGLGVLLVEIITSLKPVDNRNRSPAFSNLALLFIHHIKQGSINDLIDQRLLLLDNEENKNISINIQSSIMAVATLARQCLSLFGSDRPTMQIVANELNQIYNKLVLHDSHDEESIPLLQQLHEEYKYGAVVMEDSKYLIQSGMSESMSISNSMVSMPTMPR